MISFESASAAAIALVVLSGCCVLVRFFSRVALVKHVGPDDYLIALAWGASLALAVVLRQCLHDGSVDGQSPVEDGELTSSLRQLWATNITYDLAVLLLKDSLLLQYLRFSTDIGYRRACWALGTIVSAYGIAAFFVGIFSCHPISYSWDNSLQSGKCIDFLAFWLFNASFNSATDLIVYILPIPVLRALQLPKKQMTILVSVFLLGAFVCAASIVRLISVYAVTINNQNNPSIALWSTIEVNIGIICACLPSLRHPITQAWPRILAIRRRRNTISLSQSLTSIHVELKQPEPSLRDSELRRDSLNSETSSSKACNVVGFSTSQTGSLTKNQITTSGSPYPYNPDLGATALPRAQIRTVKETEENLDPRTRKRLPAPPFPTIPAPTARPYGPRPRPPPPLQVKPHVLTSRTHKLRYGRRMSQPLACIPEAPSLPDDGDSDGISSLLHQSPTGFPPTSPSSTYTSTFSISTADSSTYGNIAPWDAGPWTGGKTYSYEILGGPGALGQHEKDPRLPPKSTSRSRLSWSSASHSSMSSASSSRRERARREKERARRKERDMAREVDRVWQRRQGPRPLGPREMTTASAAPTRRGG